MFSPAALVLAFAVVAGLACNENAPTETRVPAGPSQTGGRVDGAELAQGDISTLAIALPVDQSVATTAPAPAFRINQTGTGPNGIFQIGPAGNTQIALQGVTKGKGQAGHFEINNTSNNQAALQTQTSGSGFAIDALATGRAGAGRFQANGVLGSTITLHMRNMGINQNAFFETTNPHNPSPTLDLRSSGVGGALQVHNTLQTSVPPAMSVTQRGTGYGAAFRIENTANLRDVILARTNGQGAAATFDKQSSHPGPVLVVKRTETDKNVGLFEGNVTVNGRLDKKSGSFKIDHPLDPDRKYLSHSFVESPDMMNVYNGNATLDANGRATVELPEYFEALNRDFRYQLTAIGAPGPNLYVAEGVKQNRFRIAGGRPYAHVSWMITGVRQDAYAEEHRIKVEEEKPAAEGEVLVRR